MENNLFLCYPKCATCKKAQKWLNDNKIEIAARDIAKENPTEEELRKWHEASGLPLKKFFNTSGKKYKEQHLKDKLPGMSEDEQYKLLATDGLLVKRPILVAESGAVLVGFKEADWQKHFGIAGQEIAPKVEPKPKKTTETKAPQAKVSVRAFQMKITLRGMKPPVWRRFFVPEDMTFQTLANVLITVMGWSGSHLSAFEMPKSGLNIMANPWSDNEDQFGDRNGKKVKLSELLPAEKKFIFVYDMGDNWEHEVVIEDVRENYPALYPAVLAYEGNCPPDDCGGVWNYMDMLEDDDEDAKEWLEECSTVYNMEETNAELRAFKAGSKK
ncbi:MAG: Spx/MgsR family RNA polymerase-binding regulatory protein [Schwartzia sp.]|nr:Spx/MgsR family RNA polymerase-binding regulatory protein [Schwartzia sp. (in: firmicutes)]